MKKYRKFNLIIFSVICSLPVSCGTLGGIGDTIDFPTSKKKIEIAIDSLFDGHPEYKIPKKWEVFNNWSERGYDFLESRIFYFKSPPEEMYYVTFIGDDKMLADSSKIGIAIRAIWNGDNRGRWLLDDSLDSKEKERVIKRFDSEIVSKLEDYTKTKAYKETY